MSFWSALRARLFRSAGKPALGPSAVVSSLSTWQQHTRIGGGLTPQDVSAILQAADTGDCYRLVCLAHDSRQKDGHLQSCLTTREQALSSLPLSIVPFTARDEREPEPRDAEVAAFVDDVIKAANGDGDEFKSTADLIPHLNGGVYHGFANAENGWARDGRRLVIDGFRLIDQRRFAFRLTDGRLVFNDTPVYGRTDGIDLRRDYPAQFIQHQPRVNGDIPLREGLSHLLVWAALFRNWTTVDWLKLAELAWKPWRIGKFGIKAGVEDKANLLRALEYLTTSGVGMIREDHNIDLVWPGSGSGGGGRGGSTHKEFADWLGSEMSKAILGQTLTTEAGTRGARSLGEVHDDIRKAIRNSDAMAVAATFRRDVVRPLVLLNFGDVPIPGVRFETEERGDLESTGKGLKAMTEAGMRIPEWWAHDVTGIPQAQDDEAVLGARIEVDVDTSELDAEAEAEAEAEQADSEAMDAENLRKFGAGIKDLKDAGTLLTQEWVRDQIGAPHPVKGDELLHGVPGEQHKYMHDIMGTGGEVVEQHRDETEMPPPDAMQEQPDGEQSETEADDA